MIDANEMIEIGYRPTHHKYNAIEIWIGLTGEIKKLKLENKALKEENQLFSELIKSPLENAVKLINSINSLCAEADCAEKVLTTCGVVNKGGKMATTQL